jgi:hypothetical protein
VFGWRPQQPKAEARALLTLAVKNSDSVYTKVRSEKRRKLNFIKLTKRPHPGANPTIVSYNATSSLRRLENKKVFFYFEKRYSLKRALKL